MPGSRARNQQWSRAFLMVGVGFDVRGNVFSQTRYHSVQAAASIVPRQTAAPHAQPNVLRSSVSSTSKL